MVAPEVDAEEAGLRDMGIQQDLSEGRPLSEGATQQPDQNAPPAAAEETGSPQSQIEPESQPPASPASEPEAVQEELPQEPTARQRDERGRFAAEDQQGKQKSKYEEAKDRQSKDGDRLDRSWQRLQAEKDEVRAERERWEEQRRMEQLQSESQMPPIQKNGIGIGEYHKAYLDFRQSGDFEHAMRALETVLELQQVQQQHITARQESTYELAWRNDMEATIQSNPEIVEEGNPLGQEVDRIINEHPYLFYIPQGFQKAVEIATLILAAGSDAELREENERLLARIEQLNGSSQPSRGGPGKPPSSGPKSIDDMTDEEAEASLRQMSEQEDFAMRR